MRGLAGLALLFALAPAAVSAAEPGRPADPGAQAAPQAAGFEPLAGIVEGQIRAGKIPGAVVLVGNRDGILFRRAFGHAALQPEKRAMAEDTVFDLASLTKVVATTTAVMQLVERGKLRLEDPAAKYWPGFGQNGKERITVQALLTHYSGLRPDLDLKGKWQGRSAALRLIAAEKPVRAPGTAFIYSDINFAALGEIVRRVSGLPLDVYCDRHIFKPLGMKDTGFVPQPAQRRRIAPTVYRRGEMLQGEVHDPTAARMGGIAGHAGVFSTADDLAVFARMLLNGGSAGGVQILQPATVEKMTMPQSPPGATRLRGLGWDIGAPFAANRDALPPVGAYGHTGYTGTSLWIDPISQAWGVILTNRVHPDGKGDVAPLRAEVAAAVAAALGPVSADDAAARRPSLAAYFEAARDAAARKDRVETGIGVLAAEGFAPLSGLRVGLITNHTGRDAAGYRTLDLLYRARGVKLAAVFSPEHGLYGNLDEKIASGAEPATSLPVHSLYGDARRPTDAMLEGLDALVFDIQDAGARFYTYITTMAYAMEAAAGKGLDFYVLDRPNPIGGEAVQGPVLDEDLKSFTGYFPLPVRHGMTVGELAQMFNAENRIGAKLHVIEMRGWRRGAWYDETGLQWVPPSPNLRTLTEAALYPGVALVEGANVSVGRGTDAPFELVGAPWVNGAELAAYLNGRNIAGVRFMPADFTPGENRYKNRLCHGVRIALTDRQALDAPALGVEIAGALYRLHPQDFQLDRTLSLIGSRQVLAALRNGEDPAAIAAQWQGKVEEFRALRAKYLLYP